MTLNQLSGYDLNEKLYEDERVLLYRARRQTDNAAVVIKTTAHTQPSPRTSERYQHERTVLARLAQSPYVAQLVALEWAAERPILVFADRGGRDLGHELNGPMAIDRALGIGCGISNALADLHNRHVVHKDIKPQNILIGREDRVQLIDFGIASLVPLEHQETRPAGQLQGTLPYMSPEQTGRMNRGVDYRSDLYSLGVTLYCMFTGALPFRADDPLGWCHCHLAQTPRPMDVLRPDIPQQIARIIERLLNKQPEERYQSAHGLLHDLERCQRELAQNGRISAFTLGETDHPLEFQVSQKLYGREHEIDVLSDHFTQVVEDGRCRLVLVAGYSGIGKSSLVHELHQPIVARRGAFLTGKFDQYRRNVPYDTLVQAFQGFVGQILTEPTTIIDTWRRRIQEALGDNGRVITDVIPELELILGPQPAIPELGPTEAQNRFHMVFRAFVRTMARSDTPLAIFLDDMQWADAATLQLLQTIFADTTIRNICFICAYRDNEVDATHPFILCIENLRRDGIEPRQITLSPLDKDSITALVADTLHRKHTDPVAQELAAAVVEKTAGNPFFVNRFLDSVHRDGLLTLDASSGRWSCDLQQIAAQGYTDNVVEHMAARLRTLDSGTQEILRLAACIGNRFELHDLCLASDSEPDQVRAAIWPAIRDNFIVQIGDAYKVASTPSDTEHTGNQLFYRFEHDRIQQAAYALLEDQERRQVHLRIGRSWMQKVSEEEREERLFALVGQLNEARELMQDPAERRAVAQLNLRAARKAQASAAYDTARSLCESALTLCGDNPWETDYQLAYGLTLCLAESALADGELKDAEARCEHLLSHSQDFDAAPVYALHIKVLVTAGRHHEAVATALKGMSRFGLELTASPDPSEIGVVYEQINTQMGTRAIEDLVDLPEMTDPQQCALMTVLSSLFDAAFFTDNNLFVVHLMHVAHRSLVYGNHPNSPSGYAWYGFLIGGVFQRYQDGHRFAQLAMRLIDRSGNRVQLGGVLFVAELTSFWTRPIDESIDFVYQAFDASREAGNMTTACYCSNHIITDHLMRGDHIDELFERGTRQEQFNRKAGYDDTADIILSIVRLADMLRGKTEGLANFDGDGFSLQDFESRLTGDRMATLVAWHNLTMMIGCYLARDYTKAAAYEQRTTETMWASFHHPQSFDYEFYRALLQAARYNDCSEEERKTFHEQIKGHHDQLKVWMQANFYNFADAYELVAAELARIEGRVDDAMGHYERAMTLAQEHRFIHHQAMACEAAARFQQRHGWETGAGMLLGEAHRLYLAWGAHAIAKRIADEYPKVRNRAAAGTITPGTIATTDAELDAATVVKATQALSREVRLDALVRRLMTIVIENAGASHANLILNYSDNQIVVYDVDGIRRVFDDAAVPKSAIAFVQRSGNRVLLADASRDPTYRSDPHIRSNGIRALLVLPINRQGELVGVLHLENRLLADAFTADRVAVVEVVAAQAAISLENATLYADLEKRVEDRTRQLRQTQRKLIDLARRAGMAQVAIDVLHNVGNQLNSVVVGIKLLREEVLQPHNWQLFQKVIELLNEHRNDLGEFLATDERGHQVIELLNHFNQLQTGAQKSMGTRLVAIDEHIDHIQTIIHRQREIAEADEPVEELEVAEFIDECLERSGDWDGIHVERQLDEVPPVRMMRQRFASILIDLLVKARLSVNKSPQPQIHINAGLNDHGRLMLSVTDNGDGLDGDELIRLFASAHGRGQAHNLHNSANTARALGGSLTAYSDGIGQGARYTLELPVQPVDSASPSARL